MLGHDMCINAGLHKMLAGSVSGNYHKTMLGGEEVISSGSSEIGRWGID